MIRHMHSSAVHTLVRPVDLAQRHQTQSSVPDIDVWGGTDVSAADLAEARYRDLVRSCAVSGSIRPADEAELLLISPEIGIRPADVLEFFKTDVEALTRVTAGSVGRRGNTDQVHGDRCTTGLQTHAMGIVGGDGRNE